MKKQPQDLLKLVESYNKLGKQINEEFDRTRKVADKTLRRFLKENRKRLFGSLQLDSRTSGDVRTWVALDIEIRHLGKRAPISSRVSMPKWMARKRATLVRRLKKATGYDFYINSNDSHSNVIYLSFEPHFELLK